MVIFAIFLRDRLSVKSLIFAVMCVCGVLLVIQPDFMFVKMEQVFWEVKDVFKVNSMSHQKQWNETMETPSLTAMTIKKDFKGMAVNGYSLPVLAGFSISLTLLLLKR